jgi:hypothetical protein
MDHYTVLHFGGGPRFKINTYLHTRLVFRGTHFKCQHEDVFTSNGVTANSLELEPFGGIFKFIFANTYYLNIYAFKF